MMALVWGRRKAMHSQSWRDLFYVDKQLYKYLQVTIKFLDYHYSDYIHNRA